MDIDALIYWTKEKSVYILALWSLGLKDGCLGIDILSIELKEGWLGIDVLPIGLKEGCLGIDVLPIELIKV